MIVSKIIDNEIFEKIYSWLVQYFSFCKAHCLILEKATLNLFTNKKSFLLINPTIRGLWNWHRLGGGLLKPSPIKTHLEALLARFFHITLMGDKNNLREVFWNRFLAQKMPFLHTFKKNPVFRPFWDPKRVWEALS